MNHVSIILPVLSPYLVSTRAGVRCQRGYQTLPFIRSTSTPARLFIGSGIHDVLGSSILIPERAVVV
jgi:hypothetical protein